MQSPSTSQETTYVRDPVQRYLAEVRRYPLLSRDDERSMAERYAAGDEALEQLLVNSNLRLVVKIALEYQNSRAGLLDLIQEGNVGLIHAVRKFDPDKGIRLASYAQWWIRAYILKYMMDNHKLVKVGTTQAQRKLFYNLSKERERLRRQGINPTPAIMARSLNVRPSDVTEMQTRLGGRETSLDAPLTDEEGGATLIDVLASDDEGTDVAIARSQLDRNLRNHLADFASGLEGRDIVIWSKRMVADEPMTLQQLGDEFGVSRERARQLEARIIKRLTKFISEHVRSRGDVVFPLAP